MQHIQRFSFRASIILAAFACFAIFPVSAPALDDSNDYNFHGRHFYRGPVDFQAELKIDGTEVTATATELNALADLELGGNLTASADEINAVADRSTRQASVTATNGQALVLNSTNTVLILSGGAEQTNTITIATSYPVGQFYTIRPAATFTNLYLLADSTTVLALGSSRLLGATDALTIYTAATNEASLINFQDN